MRFRLEAVNHLQARSGMFHLTGVYSLSYQLNIVADNDGLVLNFSLVSNVVSRRDRTDLRVERVIELLHSNHSRLGCGLAFNPTPRISRVPRPTTFARSENTARQIRITLMSVDLPEKCSGRSFQKYSNLSPNQNYPGDVTHV